MQNIREKNNRIYYKRKSRELLSNISIVIDAQFSINFMCAFLSNPIKHIHLRT